MHHIFVCQQHFGRGAVSGLIALHRVLAVWVSVADRAVSRQLELNLRVLVVRCELPPAESGLPVSRPFFFPLLPEQIGVEVVVSPLRFVLFLDEERPARLLCELVRGGRDDSPQGGRRPVRLRAAAFFVVPVPGFEIPNILGSRKDVGQMRRGIRVGAVAVSIDAEGHVGILSC